MKKIVITGGGTAGHIYPALAVAETLQGNEIHYIGGNGMEKEIIKKYPHILFHQIPTVKFERKFSLKNLSIPFKLISSINQSKKILKEINPSVIFSKGGYVSLPVAIAGHALKIPIVSHESDLSFGLSNKIILHLCDVMCTTFEETAINHKKCIHTGQPIRDEISHGRKKKFFKNDNPTILFLGGSLGAKFINTIVEKNIELLTQKYNIIHIYGQKNSNETTHENYIKFPFYDKIEDLYKSADVVISRSGSGVINELLSLSKPMILIPLPKANSRGDQIENALLFKEKGYAEVIMQDDFEINKFIKIIDKTLKNMEKITKKMKKSAKNSAKNEIFEILNNFLEKSD